jgi:WD40 repeat protein
MRNENLIWIPCFLALSCGGAAPISGAADAPKSKGKASAPGAPRSAKSDTKEAPGTAASRSNVDQTLGAENSSTAGRGKLPFELQLPQNAAFLQAPLPESSPQRYQTWNQKLSLAVGQSHLYYASFLDEERLILAHSSADGAVRVYDRTSRRLLAKHDFGAQEFEPSSLLAWEPLPGSVTSGAPLFARSTEMGVLLHEAKSGAVFARLLEGAVGAMRLSPDREILMVQSPGAGRGSLLAFFRREVPSALAPLGSLSFEERLDAWDLSRDNRLLAVAFYPSDDLAIYDLSTGRELLRIQAPKYTASVAFSPDGRFLAVGGRGLLLVDLASIEPDNSHTADRARPSRVRRAFYSYFYNNINTVVFSPSGDAIATSSYDGHIRIFRHESAGPSLTLVRSLRHTGRANVYRIQFDEAGDHLLSASGDQTVRLFGGKRGRESSSAEHAYFRPLAEWREGLPDAERLNATTPPLAEETYRSPLLAEAPRPSRILPGKYACRITDLYKLRECTVSKTSTGHTLLRFHEGNLLELEGVLYDDGPITRYEAWETVKGSVVDCPGCEKQPLRGFFRGSGRSFSGLLTFRSYFDPENLPPLPAADLKIEEADDRFPMTLRFEKELKDAREGASTEEDRQ